MKHISDARMRDGRDEGRGGSGLCFSVFHMRGSSRAIREGGLHNSTLPLANSESAPTKVAMDNGSRQAWRAVTSERACPVVTLTTTTSHASDTRCLSHRWTQSLRMQLSTSARPSASTATTRIPLARRLLHLRIDKHLRFTSGWPFAHSDAGSFATLNQ